MNTINKTQPAKILSDDEVHKEEEMYRLNHSEESPVNNTDTSDKPWRVFGKDHTQCEPAKITENNTIQEYGDSVSDKPWRVFGKDHTQCEPAKITENTPDKPWRVFGKDHTQCEPAKITENNTIQEYGDSVYVVDATTFPPNS